MTSSAAKISTTNIKNYRHFICIKFETDYLVFTRYFHTFYHSEFDILVKLKLFEIRHCYNKTPEHSKKDTEKREILKGDLNASQIKDKGPKKGKSSNTNHTSRSELRKRSITPSPTQQEGGKKTRDSSPAGHRTIDAKRSDSTEMQFSGEEVSPKPASFCSSEGSGYCKESSETPNSTRFQEEEYEDPAQVVQEAIQLRETLDYPVLQI